MLRNSETLTRFKFWRRMITILLLWYPVKINNSFYLYENTLLAPIFVLSVQYTLDRYRNICSAIKCPLETTADDYHVGASNGAVYDAIQAAYLYIGQWIMGYFCVTCLPSTIILSATYLYVLFMRLYVQAYN